MPKYRWSLRPFQQARTAVWLFFPLLSGLRLAAQTDVGGFRVPEVNEKGVLTSLMTGESARMTPNQPVAIKGLEIKFFEEDGETVSSRITSPACDYDAAAREVKSETPIRITGDGYEITGTGYVFDLETNRLEIHSESRVRFKNLNILPPQGSQPAEEDEVD